jgi:hypothetical protein
MLSIVHTVSMLIQTSLPRPFRAVPAADLSILIPIARPETHTVSRSTRNSTPRAPSLKPKSQIHQGAEAIAIVGEGGGVAGTTLRNVEFSVLDARGVNLIYQGVLNTSGF